MFYPAFIPTPHSLQSIAITWPLKERNHKSLADFLVVFHHHWPIWQQFSHLSSIRRFLNPSQCYSLCSIFQHFPTFLWFAFFLLFSQQFSKCCCLAISWDFGWHPGKICHSVCINHNRCLTKSQSSVDGVSHCSDQQTEKI